MLGMTIFRASPIQAMKQPRTGLWSLLSCMCSPQISHAFTYFLCRLSVISPLQPGQWRWTGELFVVTQEIIATPDGGQTTKNEQSRVCGVVIRDPVVNNEKATKIFTSTLESYVKGKIDIQSAFDVNVAYSEIVSGAFEGTQAGWMMCTDQEGTPEWELWKGILRKMELSLLVRWRSLNHNLVYGTNSWDLPGIRSQNLQLQKR